MSTTAEEALNILKSRINVSYYLKPDEMAAIDAACCPKPKAAPKKTVVKKAAKKTSG